ncbi:MAG TPA: ATP-binding cassette domain-containing protein [Bacteroidales bacterium]|nr:ATP-binding cassette domain-containing protein [Bacteroidales bacterium]
MVINIKNLTKTYNGKVQALKGVNIDIPEGLFGLIGRNGAGKTTLMRILTTVIKPSSGEILFDGKDIFGNLEEFRGILGYLPQSTKLMPYLNIVEFLDYVGVLKGINDQKKRNDEIKRCIETVGLTGEEKKRLAKYSGGMLRRAGIAQALIGDPKLLIIDEPTVGLDPEERMYFLNLLSRIGEGKTIIFSTHITHDIDNICENICILETGNVTYLGKKRLLIDSIRDKVWECSVNPKEEEPIKQNATILSNVYLDGKSVIRYFSEKSIYENSTRTEPTLEDAYIYSLGGLKR